MQRNEYIALGLWATGIVLLGAHTYYERELQKEERKMQEEARKEREELLNIEKKHNADFIVFHAFANDIRKNLDRELRTAEASKRDTTRPTITVPRKIPFPLSEETKRFMRDSLSAVKPISNPNP